MTRIWFRPTVKFLQLHTSDSVFWLWKPIGTKDSSFGKPRSRGVEFMDGHGLSYQFFLNETSHSSEVILTAGALGSPQLLLLSGIGPSEHLREFNIPLVLHSPSVGQRVQDNPRSSVSWLSHQYYSIQVVGILKASQNYIESLSSFVNGTLSPPGPKKDNVYSEVIFEKLAFPLSRGELRLRSTDPRDNPSVRYNYYSHPLDLERCVHGVRVISNLLNSPSLRRFNSNSSHEFDFTGKPFPKNMSDDAAVAQICRDTLNTIWHFHGGCEVGYVVNKRYEVNGVESLRIVDASTFTDGPGTNPQSTTMMLGR